jgi:hypothetical protein
MLHRHSLSSYSSASIVTSCGMWNSRRIVKVSNGRAIWGCMCVWGSKCLSCISWSHCTLDVGDELLLNRTLRLHVNEYIGFHTSIINESYIKSLYQHHQLMPWSEFRRVDDVSVRVVVSHYVTSFTMLSDILDHNKQSSTTGDKLSSTESLFKKYNIFVSNTWFLE